MALGNNSKLYIPMFSFGSGTQVAIFDVSTNTFGTSITMASGNPYNVAVNTAANKLYVTTNNGSLVVINTTTNTVSNTIAVTGSSQTRALAYVTGLSRLYVYDGAFQKIFSLNSSTEAYVSVINVSATSGPNAVVDTTYNRALFGTSSSNVVYVIGQVAPTPTITNTATITNTPTITSTASNTAAVTNTSTLTKTNTATNTPVATNTSTATATSAASPEFYTMGAGVLNRYSLAGTQLATYTESGLVYGMRRGPDGFLYAGNNSSNIIRKYNPTTLALIGDFATTNLSTPGYFAWSPNGTLYVPSYNGGSGTITRFNGTTGAYIDTIATGASNAFSLTFGPDGNMYAYYGGSVKKHNGTTGALIGTFTTGTQVSFAYGMRFFNGKLYVTSASNTIATYDATTGAYLGDIGPYSANSVDVALGPDGFIYVAMYAVGRIDKLTAAGVFVSSVVSSVASPFSIEFNGAGYPATNTPTSTNTFTPTNTTTNTATNTVTSTSTLTKTSTATNTSTITNTPIITATPTNTPVTGTDSLITTITTGVTNFAIVAVNSNTSRLYVASAGTNGSYYVYNSLTGSLVATFPVNTKANCIVVNPSNNNVYFVSGTTVYAYNDITSLGSFTITNAAGGCAVNAALNQLYYVYNGNTLRIVDLSTNTLLPASYPLPNSGFDVLNMATLGNTLYLPMFKNNTGTEVAVFNMATNTYGTSITMPAGAPFNVAVNPSTNRLYVTTFNGKMVIVNTTTNTVVTTLTFTGAGQTRDVAYVPGLNRVYVMDYIPGLVYVVDSLSETTLGTVTVGQNAFSSSAVDTANYRAFFGVFGANIPVVGQIPATATPTATLTRTPTATLTKTNTATNTATRTNTPTPSNTLTPSNTPTPTQTGGTSFMYAGFPGSIRRYTLGGVQQASVSDGNFFYSMRRGPDGYIYGALSFGDNKIRKYDPVTLTAVGNFATTNMNEPGYFDWGPDGNLYVPNYNAGTITRYNGTTGAYIDTFISGANQVFSLAFGSDGNLYTYYGNTVKKHNGTTGAFISNFAITQGFAYGMRFVNNKLYVTDIVAKDVKTYDITTGAYLGSLGPYASEPQDVDFGPDGYFYLPIPGLNRIDRVTTAGVFVDSPVTGLNSVRSVAFGYLIIPPTSTPTNTPTLTRTPTFTPSNTATLTPTLTLTPSSTATNTATFTPTATLTPIPPAGETIGVYANNVFYLRNSNSSGAPDIVSVFGDSTIDVPIAGDWDGDGYDTIGLYRTTQGVFFLSNSNTAPAPDIAFVFGNPGEIPLTGRWNNTMTADGVAIYRPSSGVLYFKNALTGGFDDLFEVFGDPGSLPVAGDWNDDGIDTIGIYRPGAAYWFLSNFNSGGIVFSDIDFGYDIGDGQALAGDWDGIGGSTVGSFTSGGIFVLHPTLNSTGTDNVFLFGPVNAQAIVGRWINPNRPPTGGVIVSGNTGGLTNGGTGDDSAE